MKNEKERSSSLMILEGFSSYKMSRNDSETKRKHSRIIKLFFFFSRLYYLFTGD
jgi:hypothetical protein